MANDNDPRGLKPLNLDPGRVHYYRVSTAADIYVGMPVQRDASGYVVGIGTPTGITQCLGVAVGFAGPYKSGLSNNDPFLDVSDLTPPTGLDTGDRYVAVADDPDQLFLAQEDTGGTALALADIHAGVDLIFRGAGATVVNGNDDSGWANLELDASTVAATTNLFVQVQALHEAPNSDGTFNAVGDFAKWVVKILHHQNKGVVVYDPVV